MGKKKIEGVPLKEQIKPVFENRFKQLLKTEENWQKFKEILFVPQRKSFRINELKVNNIDLIYNNIKEKGFDLSPVPWCKNSYYINYLEGCRTDIGNLKEHFLGQIYIQEATSMCPPELLDIPENISNDFSVLDMAASPGSKTTQIGAKMQNKGILIANEVDWKRLGPLKINLERTGLTNVIITNNDGTKINGEEIFDRILLDAPCSGSGVIRKSPGTIKTYNPNRLKALVNLQLKLLQRAFNLLKKGGIMTYSTCSLDPEENELCIQKFLSINPDAILEKAELPNLLLTNKVSFFNEINIDKIVTENTIRIWPQDNDTNGFYVAKLRKKK